jgi:hypothetical protein
VFRGGQRQSDFFFDGKGDFKRSLEAGVTNEIKYFQDDRDSRAVVGA